MDDAILEEVRTLVAEQLGVDRSTVTATASFEEDLESLPAADVTVIV